jgi:hypothetical protein
MHRTSDRGRGDNSMSNSTQPHGQRHLYVDDDLLDDEGIQNLVNLIKILDEIERGLTPEQRGEIFGSENWRSECDKNSERG